MKHDLTSFNTRILVTDDNQAIHEDFRKTLCPEQTADAALDASEDALFGSSRPERAGLSFTLDFAYQGEEALVKVARAKGAGLPYAVVFVDVRMPPGLDGVETAARMWEIDPDLEIVICTAYSDYGWQQVAGKLRRPRQLMVLKKPFDVLEVLQLADTLTRRWCEARNVEQQLVLLQRAIQAHPHAPADAATESPSATEALAALDTVARQQFIMEQDLRAALRERQLSVHYQPLIEIETRRAIGLEALVRWQHPTKGAISPAAFIPVAEETGLILEVGEFVLETVCEQLVHWRGEGIETVPIAVNVSAKQMEKGGILPLVRRVLAKTGLDAGSLALELTESALLKERSSQIDELRELRSMGMRIEMDDFGTGYSSLSYLRELPIDTLKIDRSFIRKIDADPVDRSIVRAILSMAASLGLRVVAEGVETAAQLEVLKSEGCGFAQGFYFSRPIPALQCRALLRELQRRPSFTETLRLECFAAQASLAPTSKP